MDSVLNYCKTLLKEREKSNKMQLEYETRLLDHEEKIREDFRRIDAESLIAKSVSERKYVTPPVVEYTSDFGTDERRDTRMKCGVLRKVVRDINRHGNAPARLVVTSDDYPRFECSAHFSWSLNSSTYLIGDRVIGKISGLFSN
jgi:hypothetical protein